MEQLRELVAKTKVLNDAILRSKSDGPDYYEKIKQLLDDPSINVNLEALGVELPARNALKTENDKVVQLFVCCTNEGMQ